MKKLEKFQDFQEKVFEGGNAIKSSRGIQEREVDKTWDSIFKTLLPEIGLREEDVFKIGSAGKKANEEDSSGDLDLGIDAKSLERIFKDKSGLKEISQALYDRILGMDFDLSGDLEVEYLKGLNIVSIGWPIGGDFSNGIVQLDLIPVSDVNWAKFIYYSPDQKKGESKYKSAHRNWLFSAILRSMREVIKTNEKGEVMEYITPVIRLSEGLFKNRKSFEGKRVERLARAKKIPGSEKFITSDPVEFLEFVFGKKIDPDRVKTVEDVIRILKSPDVSRNKDLEKIKEDYITFLERGKLEIPVEINNV